MAKKKKKVAKKKIVTPKDAPKDVTELPELSEPESTLVEELATELIPIEAIPGPVPEPEPVNCAKCGTLTKHMVACGKCGALMCITCSGHSPCPRCGV